MSYKVMSKNTRFKAPKSLRPTFKGTAIISNRGVTLDKDTIEYLREFNWIVFAYSEEKNSLSIKPFIEKGYNAYKVPVAHRWLHNEPLESLITSLGIKDGTELPVTVVVKDSIIYISFNKTNERVYSDVDYGIY